MHMFICTALTVFCTNLFFLVQISFYSFRRIGDEIFHRWDLFLSTVQK